MLSYFHRFSIFVWKGENDSNTLRVDAYVLENGEKISVFKKYPDTCGWGLLSMGLREYTLLGKTGAHKLKCSRARMARRLLTKCLFKGNKLNGLKMIVNLISGGFSSI